MPCHFDDDNLDYEDDNDVCDNDDDDDDDEFSVIVIIPLFIVNVYSLSRHSTFLC